MTGSPPDGPFGRREFLRRSGLTIAGLGTIRWNGLPGEVVARPSSFDGTSSSTDRLDWWREARFGMFVHFGLYSLLGGEWKGKPAGSHEWIRNNAKIPIDEYVPLVRRFDPGGFDADAWASLAAEAGQKYLVITTKHHEGFSLFDSKHTGYDVMATPFRRDIMREVADACRRHGIRPCWYYSIMDWYHPDYLPRRDWEASSRPASGADFRRYVAFMHAQLEELLTHYGDIGLLWFDGQWEGTWTHELALALAERCRSLQPGIIINNRIDKPGPNGQIPGAGPNGSDQWRASFSAGDYSTPELNIPDTGVPGEPWETCMTMNDNWGYSRFDRSYKSPRQLIALLVETASKGGNLLLNVGPDQDGRIPVECVEQLQAVGGWMAVHGKAIYGSEANPFPKPPHGVRVTAQRNRLNLFLADWKGGELFLPGLRTEIRRATLLADRARTPLPTRRVEGGAEIVLPEKAPDPLCSVVVVEFDSAPVVRG